MLLLSKNGLVPISLEVMHAEVLSGLGVEDRKVI